MTERGTLLLHTEGSAFLDGKYDLRSVERILSNYRKLIDSTLPFAIGHKTLTPQLRDQIRYQVSFRKGSWETILQFVVEHKEVVAALIAVDGGQQMALSVGKLLDAILKFRRFFSDFLDKGETPRIQANTNNPQNVNVHVDIHDVSTNGGNIYVNPIIIPAAEATRLSYDNLINSVDGDKVTRINIASPKSQASIVQGDRRITGTQKEELPSHIDVTGRLDAVAFTSHRGQLVTPDGRYPVSWPEEIRHKIQKFVDTDGIVWKVRPIVDHKRFKHDPVAFHVMDCFDPQARLAL